MEGACAHFGMGRALSASHAGGTRNSSWIIETPSGKYVLRRRFKGYSVKGWLEYDHAVLRHLLERGVPVAPLAAAPDGSTAWRAPDGASWEACRFVPGRHLRTGDGDDLASLGAALSAFHREGSSFRPRFDKLGPRGEADPRCLLALMERIEAEGAAEAVLPFKSLLADAANALDDRTYSSLPETLAHGDAQPGNIIVGDGGAVKALVDLDWCCRRPRIYDLAFVVLTCCGRKESPEAEELWKLTSTPALDERALDKFFKAYLAGAGPFSGGEAKALVRQTEIAWCHIRVANSLKVPARQRAEFISRKPPLDISPLKNVLARSADAFT